MIAEAPRSPSPIAASGPATSRPWAAPAVLALLALLGRSARAHDGDPQVPVEHYRLANGLEVILQRDNTVPLVYVSIWYHVSSGDETPGKSGFAHLFEHMMFQGSQHVGKLQHIDVLKSVGGTSINATTNTVRTNYFELVPSNQLEVALWLESDRMGYLLPLLSEERLANQREVVRNERRQAYDNQPYATERFTTHRLLYGGGHPYRHLTIGLHEDLARSSLEDVRRFFQEWYVPANATLLLAGDIESAATKRLIEKWFGSLPSVARPVHRPIPPTPLTAIRREVVADDFAKLRRIRYAWHSPKAFAPGDAELDILANVLGRAGTGRFYRLLVHQKQWAQQVSVVQQKQEASGIFQIIVDLKPEADQAEVEAALNAELDRVRSEPITERERRRAVKELEAGLVRTLEGLDSRGEVLQMYNHFFGEPGAFSRHLATFRTSTPASVRAAAASWLQPFQRVEVITMPAHAAVSPVSLGSAPPEGGN